MRLTKRKTLEICKELWTWMRDNEKKCSGDKMFWPGWDKYGEMAGDCPCCEYDRRHGDTCVHCPLLKTWTSVVSESYYQPCALSPISPFQSFWYGRGTPADAQEIIDACDAELAKLNRRAK